MSKKKKRVSVNRFEHDFKVMAQSKLGTLYQEYFIRVLQGFCANPAFVNIEPDSLVDVASGVTDFAIQKLVDLSQEKEPEPEKQIPNPPKVEKRNG